MVAYLLRKHVWHQRCMVIGKTFLSAGARLLQWIVWKKIVLSRYRVKENPPRLYRALPSKHGEGVLRLRDARRTRGEAGTPSSRYPEKRADVGLEIGVCVLVD